MVAALGHPPSPKKLCVGNPPSHPVARRLDRGAYRTGQVLVIMPQVETRERQIFEIGPKTRARAAR
jgi:hypothetical protein